MRCYDSSVENRLYDLVPYSPLHYPGDYGFIPGTLTEGHDPLDVLALVDEPSFPGVMILVRPVGVFEMVDQEELDQKILAVPTRNSSTSSRSTKSSKASELKMRGWYGPRDAREIIRLARASYLQVRGTEASSAVTR